MPFFTTYTFVNLDDDETLPIENSFIDFGAATGAADVIGLKNGGLAGIGDSSPFIFSGTVFDATGDSIGAMGDNTNAGTNGSMAQLSDDNIVVVTESSGFLNYRIFDSETGATVVDTTGLSPPGNTNSDVAALTNGSFAIVAQRNISGSNNDIVLTIVSNDGNTVSPEIVIDSTAANDAEPSIAQLDGGNIVIAWTRTVGSQTEIWYSIRNATGGEVKAATLFDTQSSVNRNVSVTALDDGGFAMAYEDREHGTGNVDITLATLDANGDNSEKHIVDDSVSISDPSLIRLKNGLLAMSYTQTFGSDHDSFVALIDPESGEVLADRDIITTSISNDNIDSVLAEFGVGNLLIVDNDATDGDVVGETLLVIRQSVGDEFSNNNFTGDDFIDSVFGGDSNSFSDTLNGAGGNDSIFGLAGNDSLSGGRGDDLLEGESGLDTINGGDGNDRIFGMTEADPSGSASADFLNGGNGNDQITAANGFNTLRGDGGNDTIIGGNSGDTITGGAGKDSVDGGNGQDTLIIDASGIQSGETFRGGTGNDSIVINGGGSKYLFSGVTLESINALTFGAGLLGAREMVFNGEQFSGGIESNATIDGRSGLSDLITINMGSATVLDLISVGFTDGDDAGNDRVKITGDANNELINASIIADNIRSGDGNDSINGVNGIDTINGGAGADIIGGGASGDLLTGGKGKDTFDYNDIAEFSIGVGRDTITDFTIDPAGGAGFVDRFDVAGMDAQESASGDQAFSFIGTATFTAEGQIRAIQSGADTRVLFNTNGSTNAEAEILLTNFTAANLGDGDFIGLV